jgi:hypothetical protein
MSVKASPLKGVIIFTVKTSGFMPVAHPASTFVPLWFYYRKIISGFPKQQFRFTPDPIFGSHTERYGAFSQAATT